MVLYTEGSYGQLYSTGVCTMCSERCLIRPKSIMFDFSIVGTMTDYSRREGRLAVRRHHKRDMYNRLRWENKMEKSGVRGETRLGKGSKRI
jgi:hypothetical protein